MEARNKNTIVKMACNYKEIIHRSRSRIGYHVYLSWYTSDFRKLSHINQLQITKGRQWVVRNGGICVPDPTINPVIDIDSESEIESVATYDPIVEAKVKGSEMAIAAGANWRSLSEEIRNAWKARAIMLNRRVLPGKFTHVPFTLRNNFEKKVLSSVSNEWYNFGKNMQRSLVRHPRSTDSARMFTFGSERIEMLGRTYRVVFMTDLLRECVFGEDMKRIKKMEIITKTNHRAILHIASNDRMNKIFKLNSFCASKATINNVVHSCAGKVILEKNNEQILGYITHEFRHQIVVVTANNETVQLPRPVLIFNSSNQFSYQFAYSSRTRYKIIEYNPIRIIVSSNGTFKYICNRFAINDATKEINYFYSS